MDGLSSARTARRRVWVSALLGVLSLAAGCQIPCLRGPCASQAVPATFKGSSNTDNSAQLPVAEYFNDGALLSLLQQALAGNQELKVLAEEIQVANNEVLLRRGAYMPFGTIVGGAGLERTPRYTRNGAVDDVVEIVPGRRVPNPLPDFLVAGKFTWQVDIWRKLRNARDAAALRCLATEDGRNYVVTRLVAEVAATYYELLALDARLETLDQTIALQEASRKIADGKKKAGRGTELAVLRFDAEVSRNQSEKLIVKQDIVERENRINFLAGRFPQPIERTPADFLELSLRTLCVGVPAQLLANRPDIRQAERELAAAGLDVAVARADFLPSLAIEGGIGLQAFNLKYLLNAQSFVAEAAAGVAAPLVNRSAIKAAYGTANAKQLQAVYKYQQVVVDAFNEVVNRVSKVENYRRSIELKQRQLAALKASVETADKLFQNARAEYSEVLFAQRDLLEARLALIETKRQQLAAIVDAYQALGGGDPARDAGTRGASQTCPPASQASAAATSNSPDMVLAKASGGKAADGNPKDVKPSQDRPPAEGSKTKKDSAVRPLSNGSGETSAGAKPQQDGKQRPLELPNLLPASIEPPSAVHSLESTQKPVEIAPAQRPIQPAGYEPLGWSVIYDSKPQSKL